MQARISSNLLVAPLGPQWSLLTLMVPATIALLTVGLAAAVVFLVVVVAFLVDVLVFLVEVLLLGGADTG